MNHNLQKHTRPEPPPWPVILINLALAMISAWLVFMRDWESWRAFSVVGFTALGITFVLFVALIIWTPTEDRAEVARHVWNTCWEDIDLILKYFRIKK